MAVTVKNASDSKKQTIKGILFLLSAFFLAGTSVIAGRYVTGILGTFTIAASSLLLALVVLLPLCASRIYSYLRGSDSRVWLSLLLQALFGVFLFRAFLLQGLCYTSTGEAGILTGATPAVTALLAWGILRESLSAARMLGIGSTLAGILILQGLFSPAAEFVWSHFFGNLLVLSAAVCESLFNVFSRMNSLYAAKSEVGFEPLVQSTIVVMLAFFLCLGPTLAEKPAAALLVLPVSGWLALLWYGFFVTALAFICWYAGIKRCDASMAAIFAGMMPLTGMVLAVIVLKESIAWIQWLGGTLVVMGMLLAGLPKRWPALPWLTNWSSLRKIRRRLAWLSFFP